MIYNHKCWSFALLLRDLPSLDVSFLWGLFAP